MSKKSESFSTGVMDAQSQAIINDITHAKPEQEPIHKLSQNQVAESRGVMLKPVRTLPDSNPFNETYRADYEYDRQTVSFIAENRELIGCPIELWTKKYRGQPYEYWEVPTGVVVYGPRYLAEQISKCSYRRLKAENGVKESNGMGQIIGGLQVESTIQRLDAQPVNTGRKSVFMGVDG